MARASTGVGRGLDLLALDQVGGAFQRHPARLHRRPGQAQLGHVAGRAVAGHRRGAEAVGLADLHRVERHGPVVEGGERAGVVAGDAAPLGVGADHVAGVVDEGHERQLVGVAQLDEAGGLVGGRAVDGPGVGGERLVGEDADAAAAEAGQGGDHRRRPGASQLEHAAVVGEGLDQAAHVVGPAPVVGHDRADRLVAAATARHRRGRPAGRRTRSAGSGGRCSQRGVLVVDEQVDLAPGGQLVDGALEDLLLGPLAGAAADGGAAHADHQVAQEDQPGVAVQHPARDDGDGRRPARQLGQAVVDVEASPRVDDDRRQRQVVAGAGTVTVDDDDQRPAVRVRQVDQLAQLALVAVALGAVGHRPVVGGGHHRVPVDLADAADQPVGGAVVVHAGGPAGQGPVLDEAALVEEPSPAAVGRPGTRPRLRRGRRDLADRELLHRDLVRTGRGRGRSSRPQPCTTTLAAIPAVPAVACGRTLSAQAAAGAREVAARWTAGRCGAGGDVLDARLSQQPDAGAATRRNVHRVVSASGVAVVAAALIVVGFIQYTRRRRCRTRMSANRLSRRQKQMH